MIARIIPIYGGPVQYGGTRFTPIRGLCTSGKRGKSFFRSTISRLFFFVFPTMANKNSTRNLFRSLNRMVRIRGTRFFNCNNSTIIILLRRLNHTIRPLNISVISRNNTNLLLRRHERVQQTSRTRNHRTLRYRQLKSVRISMVRRLLSNKQRLLRQMTTSVNTMVPRRLPRRLAKSLINLLGSTNMLTKSNVGVVKVRLTKLSNLTRRNIRSSRRILLLMRQTFRPPTMNRTKIVIRNLNNNFIITTTRNVRSTILKFMPLFRRKSKSVLLRLQLIRVPSIQIRTRKRGLLRLLRSRVLPCRRPSRSPSNRMGVIHLRRLSTIMMFLRNVLSILTRMTTNPLTNLLTTKTGNP